MMISVVVVDGFDDVAAGNFTVDNVDVPVRRVRLHGCAWWCWFRPSLTLSASLPHHLLTTCTTATLGYPFRIQISGACVKVMLVCVRHANKGHFSRLAHAIYYNCIGAGRFPWLFLYLVCVSHHIRLTHTGVT